MISRIRSVIKQFPANAGNLVFLVLILSQCAGSGSFHFSNINIPLANSLNPDQEAQSIIGKESPDGLDLLGASTNFSSKIFDPGEKADPLAEANLIAQPRISNDGAVTSSYKLSVPQGRAGIMPQISLSYSSSGGDGWLGLGWSLGLGSISRSSRYGQIYFDFRDTFIYNGKRLTKVSGPENSENGEYRPEIEDGSFFRLTLTDAKNGGVWTVEDSAGQKTYYGQNISERTYRPDNVSQTYIWHFSRTEDLNGNFMSATYDTSEYSSNHALYLKELWYTGNTQTGALPKLFVRFNLKNRNDFYVTTAPGFIIKMNKLLDSIEMGKTGRFWGTTTLWDYQLKYILSEDSNRPLLDSIFSSKNTTSPRFHYQNAEHYFTWQITGNVFASDPENNPQSTKFFEGDFTGDGISDMAFFNPKSGDWKVVESHFSGSKIFRTWATFYKGYESEEQIRWFRGNVTGDFNGDGKSDIAFYLPATREFVVAESRGYFFQFRSYGRLDIANLNIFGSEWFNGDFDGNGLSDAVIFDEKTGDWILMANQGGAFSFTKFAHNFQNLYRSDYPTGTSIEGQNFAFTGDISKEGESRGQIHWLGGDYNADGRTDLAFYDARNGKWWVAENYRDNVAGFRLKWKIYQIFNVPSQSLFSHEQFSGDFNGDGFSDFLFYNRTRQEWTLGMVSMDLQGNSSVDFQIWSSIPESQNITRWLQGDFNGDGRTDIGFYSNTDNNFWIGESTLSGFRYRIYSNLSAGAPDTARIMSTPLPEEDIEIKKHDELIATSLTTWRITSEYDANRNIHHGELVFTGCFSGNCQTPEQLIYDRALKKFRFLQYSQSIVETSIFFELSTGVNRFITSRRLFLNKTTGKDEIIVYEQGGITHNFFRIHNNGTSFLKTLIASFSNESGAPSNFDINRCLYRINDFDRDGSPDLLVLDDQGSGNFILYSNNMATTLVVPENSPMLFKNIFAENSQSTDRNQRNYLKFFSGNFDGDANDETDLLIADTRQTPQKWYLATFNLPGNSITIIQVDGNVFIPADDSKTEFDELNRTINLTGSGLGKHELVYASFENGRQSLHRIYLYGTKIQSMDYSLPADNFFKRQINHDGKPVIQTPHGFLLMVFNGSFYSLETPDLDSGIYPAYSISRPDLYGKVYPFQWIQGDYNGDTKTDIGLFNLRETNWYFAMTQGTAPDLLQKIENGIGGSYSFEYANSSSFDNTGGDDIPDLPVNYKVCIKLTIDNGFGKTMYNNFEYKNGFSFSSFINGKKETDYFGFSDFTEIDPYGSKTRRLYHTTPYANYLYNRSLNGAIKEVRFTGYDSREYSRSETDYYVNEIHPAANSTVFIVYPSGNRNYVQNILKSSSAKKLELSSGDFKLLSIRTSNTDHFSDSAHDSITISAKKIFTYDSATNQQKLLRDISFANTSFEITTSYQYDTSGNPMEVRTNYTGLGLPSIDEKVMRFEYDDYGNKTLEEDASANPTQKTEFQYDSEFNSFIILQKSFTDNDSLDVSTDYSNESTAFGNPSKVIDANGNARYYEYDSFGRLEKIKADTDHGTQTLSERIYSQSGGNAASSGLEISSRELPLSAKTVFYTGSTSGQDNVQSRVYIDGLGRVIHTIQSAISGVSGHEFIKTGMTVYDDLGRVRRQSQTEWAKPEEINVYIPHSSEKNPTVTTYDASGRVQSVTLPITLAQFSENALDADQGFSTTTTYSDPWEITIRDSGGKSKKETRNARGLSLYIEEFNTNDLSLKAKMGFCYNAAGNMTLRSDLDNGPINCPDEFNTSNVPDGPDTSGYNKSLRLYDALGNLRESNDPDTGKSVLEYDAFGRLSRTTDAKGQTITMKYDRLGRLIQKILPGFQGYVSYRYDSSGGSENARGNLVQMIDQAQKKEFSYDKLGNRKTERRYLRSLKNTDNYEEAVTTEFIYDLTGKTQRIDYPFDSATGMRASVCYQYNSFGFAKSAGVSFSADCSAIDRAIITNMDYNEFGQVTKVEHGNGATTEYEYDTRGRATRIITQAERNGVTVKHQDVSYNFNPNNSIASIRNNPTMEKVGAASSAYTVHYDYTYDGLNRLVDAQGEYSRYGLDANQTVDAHLLGIEKFHRRYSYSANGNLVQKKFFEPETGDLSDTWNYNYNNHRVSSINSTKILGPKYSFAYDENGNTIQKKDMQNGQTKKMLYDYANRITEVADTEGNVMGKYEYDDQGFRVRKIVQKTVNGNPERVVLSTHNQYFATERRQTLEGFEIPGTEIAINNIYLNGVRIATVDSGANSRYYLGDQVDSVHVVLDDAGLVVKRTEYLPYGEVWDVESAAEGHKTNSDNIKFGVISGSWPKYNGQSLDTETGYYFYNARHYDPEIARFVTADTMVDGASTVAGWNRYMYVHGNPVMYKDPSGHWGEGSQAFGIANTMQGIGDFLGLTGRNGTADSGNSATKTMVEGSTSKSMDSAGTRTSSKEKSPDLSVKMSIEGNIVEDGKVVGMRGTQTVTYRDKSGKVTEHTIKDMVWKEDGVVEDNKYRYEMPAAPERFDIRKKKPGQKYDIDTSHSEGGIMIHGKGDSEGCIEMDRWTKDGKTIYNDLLQRTKNNEILSGEIKQVIDNRSQSEQNKAPVYYSKNPNYSRRED